MKNHVARIVTFAVFVIATFSILPGCASKNDKIVGEWKGQTPGTDPVRLIFDKANRSVFSIGSVVLGGKNVIQGRKIELKYETDYSKTPYTIDLTEIEDGVENKAPFAKGIFRFISDTKMELRMRTGAGNRFTGFDSGDKENTIVLEKTN